MPGSGLINTDPIVARSFFLDFPNLAGFVLSGVSGMDIEMDVVTLEQTGKDGKQQHVKTLGGKLKVPEISVTRMAPKKDENDKLWAWFLDIREHGFKNRTDHRQDGSIVLYDSTGTEVSRYNIFGCWPSKISVDSLSTDSNEPLKETITFQAERIELAK
jgi:phage tail-like protein